MCQTYQVDNGFLNCSLETAQPSRHHNGYLISKRWFQTPLQPCLLQKYMCWCRGHKFFHMYMNYKCRYINKIP